MISRHIPIAKLVPLIVIFQSAPALSVEKAGSNEAQAASADAIIMRNNRVMLSLVPRCAKRDSGFQQKFDVNYTSWAAAFRSFIDRGEQRMQVAATQAGLTVDALFEREFQKESGRTLSDLKNLADEPFDGACSTIFKMLEQRPPK
jgi:hypothetical protein